MRHKHTTRYKPNADCKKCNIDKVCDHKLNKKKHCYSFERYKRWIQKVPPTETTRYAYLRKSWFSDSVFVCSRCGCAYSNLGPGIILNYCSKCGAKFIEGE